MADERPLEHGSAAGEHNADRDADDAPVIAVPPHSPLPPPPTVSYTRPPSARIAATGGKPSPLDAGAAGSGGDYGAAGHGAGLAAGTSFVVSIVAGAMAGNWIDTHYVHSAMPWATMVMTLIGFAAGFLNLTRIMARANRNKNDK